MRKYVGSFDPQTKLCTVHVVDDVAGINQELPLGIAVRIHASGFTWGYNGPGAAQLAIAICLDALDGDIDRARAVYLVYKHRLQLLSPDEGWTLTQQEVLERITAIEAVMLDRAERPATLKVPF